MIKVNPRLRGATKRYAEKLLFVGIDYDEKEKTHSCSMEMFEK